LQPFRPLLSALNVKAALCFLLFPISSACGSFNFAVMSNLLDIPFKKTYPTDIKRAVKRYITEHAGAHPDEFTEDIKTWQDLRKDGVGGVLHENRIDSTLL
jgi:hypothetical protein